MLYTNKQVETLLSLTQPLQSTYKTLISLGKGSASEVAEVTGKTRAAESDYLNQLVNMNIIGKHGVSTKKRGRQPVIFRILAEEEAKKK